MSALNVINDQTNLLRKTLILELTNDQKYFGFYKIDQAALHGLLDLFLNLVQPFRDALFSDFRPGVLGIKTKTDFKKVLDSKY